MMAKSKGFVNLTARVPESICDFLDDIHWDFKNSRAGLARIAIVEWCQAHGYDAWMAQRNVEAPDSGDE